MPNKKPSCPQQLVPLYAKVKTPEGFEVRAVNAKIEGNFVGLLARKYSPGPGGGGPCTHVVPVTDEFALLWNDDGSLVLEEY